MSTEELFEIVDPWYTTGQLSEADKPAIQQVYTELTGDPGERCRTCPSYWSDVLHALRIHLKSFGYQSMSNDQKYMIRPDAGFLQVHGLPYAYINKGFAPETESAKFLTDKIAEELLKENPDRKLVIVVNPDYVEKAAVKADSGADAKPKTAKAAPAKKGKTAKAADPAPTDEGKEPASVITPPVTPDDQQPETNS